MDDFNVEDLNPLTEEELDTLDISRLFGVPIDNSISYLKSIKRKYKSCPQLSIVYDYPTNKLHLIGVRSESINPEHEEKKRRIKSLRTKQSRLGNRIKRQKDELRRLAAEEKDLDESI